MHMVLLFPSQGRQQGRKSWHGGQVQPRTEKLAGFQLAQQKYTCC
jgi:hypothetical protein